MRKVVLSLATVVSAAAFVFLIVVMASQGLYEGGRVGWSTGRTAEYRRRRLARPIS